MLLGFRQYLHNLHSFEDLRQILKYAENSPLMEEGNCEVFIALCGENPRTVLQKENLEPDVALYDYSHLHLSPSQCVKRLIADYHDHAFLKIIHYSRFPEGLTYPIDLFTQMAAFMNYDHLAVSDSDFQISFAEIIRAFKYHIQESSSNRITITFPRRYHRSLDPKNYPINRWAMEDIENLYVYFLSNIKFLEMKLDIQSGLFFTNRMSNILLDFNKVGKWVGNLHLAISLLRDPEIRVQQIEVQTNPQNDSSINFEVQCAKINELYDYYQIPMENIIRIALDNPRKYLMSDWSYSLPLPAIEATLQRIFEIYSHYKNPQAMA